MPPLGEDYLNAPHMTFLNDSTSSFRSTFSLGHHNKKSNKVAFSEDILVEETLHVNDLTDEEYQSYWLTASEFSLIVDMADITTDLMQLGEKEDHEGNICYRGLEGRTLAANQKYTDRYLDMVIAILEEQDYQRQAGFADPERVALLCLDQTQNCREDALARAQEDECDIQESLKRR